MWLWNHRIQRSVEITEIYCTCVLLHFWEKIRESNDLSKKLLKSWFDEIFSFYTTIYQNISWYQLSLYWYDSMIYVDFTKYFAKDNEFFHHNAHDEALHTHSVWKWKIYFHQNKFRHINYLVILLVKTSFSRNFFQYVVNFWNFHSAVWNYRI